MGTKRPPRSLVLDGETQAFDIDEFVHLCSDGSSLLVQWSLSTGNCGILVGPEAWVVSLGGF